VIIINGDVCVADGDLFRRVILQSGSALNPWSLVDNPETVLRQLLSYSLSTLNCTPSFQPHLQHQQLIACLRHVPVNQLLDIDLPKASYRSHLGPVISEDDRMSDVRQAPLKSRDSAVPSWSRLNLLLGFVSNEGIHYNSSLVPYCWVLVVFFLVCLHCKIGKCTSTANTRRNKKSN